MVSQEFVVQFKHAALQFQNSHFSKAAEAFENIVKGADFFSADPNLKFEVLFRLAVSLIEVSRRDDARKIFESPTFKTLLSQLQDSEKKFRFYFHLAKVCDRLGDVDSASHFFTCAFQTAWHSAQPEKSADEVLVAHMELLQKNQRWNDVYKLAQQADAFAEEFSRYSLQIKSIEIADEAQRKLRDPLHISA